MTSVGRKIHSDRKPKHSTLTQNMRNFILLSISTTKINTNFVVRTTTSTGSPTYAYGIKSALLHSRLDNLFPILNCKYFRLKHTLHVRFMIDVKRFLVHSFNVLHSTLSLLLGAGGDTQYVIINIYLYGYGYES